eukprot:9981470-Prorocentrum_lima.AAC.1
MVKYLNKDNTKFKEEQFRVSNKDQLNYHLKVWTRGYDVRKGSNPASTSTTMEWRDSTTPTTTVKVAPTATTGTS